MITLHVHTITLNDNSIRPLGEKLLTFGGRRAGYEPLKGVHKCTPFNYIKYTQ